MRFERVQFTRLAQGQSAQEWQHALEHLDPSRIRILKHPAIARLRPHPAIHDVSCFTAYDAVLLFHLASRPVILKLRPLSTWRRRVQSLTRTSQLHRQWRGTTLLERASIPSARCLASGTLATGHPSTRYEWLATSFIEGPTLLRALAVARGTPAELTLAQTAGRLIASLASAKPTPLYNRDLKPSNVMLITPWSPNTPTPVPKLAIIDPVGVRRGTGQREQLARMLASLFIEPLGCDLAPSPRASHACITQAARMLSLSLRDARSLWRAAATIIDSHGDPTPKVNPLTPTQE